MKKKLFTFIAAGILAVACLGLAACSTADTEPAESLNPNQIATSAEEITEDNIVGNWKLDVFYNNEGEPSIDKCEGFSCTINPDGTGTYTDEGVTYDFTWSVYQSEPSAVSYIMNDGTTEYFALIQYAGDPGTMLMFGPMEDNSCYICVAC